MKKYNEVIQPTFKKLTYLCMQTLTNFPFIEEDFDALTNYELLCKVVEYLNKVIANENKQNEDIQTLANAFNQLKNYVDNYFDNLDVQDEINNKLDEMVEDGTLENLINNKLQLIRVYPTVSDMIENEDTLVKGLCVKTLGFNSVGDGGAANYYIDDSAYHTLIDSSIFEEASIPLSNSLYANLVKTTNEVSIAQLGAEPNTDITTLLQKAVNYFRYILIPRGEYTISSTIYIPAGGNIIGVHRRYSILKFTGTDFALQVQYGSQIKDIGIDCTAGTYTQDNSIMGQLTTDPCIVQTWTRENVSGIDFVAAHSFAQRVEVSNASLYGFRPSTYCEITDCLATNCKYSYAPVTDNMITNCTAQYCEVGIYLNNAYTNTLDNIRIDECAKHFLYISGGNGNIVNFLGGQAHQAGIVLNATNRNKIKGFVSRCCQISRGKSYEDSNVPLDDYAICETGYCTNNDIDVTIQTGDSFLYNENIHSYFPKRILSVENCYDVYKIISQFATANDTLVQNAGASHDFDYKPYFNIGYARTKVDLNYVKLTFSGSGNNYYLNDMASGTTNWGLGNCVRYNAGKLIFNINNTQITLTPDQN